MPSLKQVATTTMASNTVTPTPPCVSTSATIKPAGPMTAVVMA